MVEQHEPGVYRHYRNNQLYLCLGISRNRTKSEGNPHGDGNPMVTYVALYENEDGQNVHRRSPADFSEIQWPVANLRTPRFLPVEERVWSQQLSGKYIGFVKAYLAMVKKEG